MHGLRQFPDTQASSSLHSTSAEQMSDTEKMRLVRYSAEDYVVDFYIDLCFE